VGRDWFLGSIPPFLRKKKIMTLPLYDYYSAQIAPLVSPDYSPTKASREAGKIRTASFNWTPTVAMAGADAKKVLLARIPKHASILGGVIRARRWNSDVALSVGSVQLHMIGVSNQMSMLKSDDAEAIYANPGFPVSSLLTFDAPIFDTYFTFTAVYPFQESGIMVKDWPGLTNEEGFIRASVVGDWQVSDNNGISGYVMYTIE